MIQIRHVGRAQADDDAVCCCGKAMLLHPPACRACNGTGRADGSDNVNWLPCGTCFGSGVSHLLPGERVNLRGVK